MAEIRYESVLVEQALAKEYALEIETTLKKMGGLNDIKGLIRDFEKDFARYLSVEYAIAVNSGSDALKMILLSLGVGKGNEVIVPNLTYQAVALAVFYCGATPIPVDARREDLLMDPDEVESAITKRTKAVIAAHMFGRPCDVERIKKLCREKKICFVEDVCQAESSKYNGQMLGSFGDMAAFSFSYYKPLSSCGGGGGMVAFNGEGGSRVRQWMEDWRDDDELLKLGQRFAPIPFMDLMALRVKFRHLPKIIESRRQAKALYEQGLEGVAGLTVFKDRPHTESVAQNFVVCCNKRDHLFEYLATHGIQAQKPYLSLHRMNVFKDMNQKKFPVSAWYSANAVHLPLYSFMNQEKTQKVIECCRAFMKGHQA
jgi:dTDP-4-amino-4,6-dideoxygalactose transaminase